MTAVEGKNVTLYIYKSIGDLAPAPVLAVCATNVTRKESAEKINITTVDSGKENEYIGGATDASIVLEGVRTLDDVSHFQIDDFTIGAVEHVILIYEDALGNIVSYDANVLIDDIEDSNDVADFSTYSVSMTRSGAWIKLFNANGILVDGDGNPIVDGDGNLIYVE